MQYRQARRNFSVDPVRKRTRRGGWLHRLIAGAADRAIPAVPNFFPEALEVRRMLHTFNNYGTGVSDVQNFYSGQNQVCQIAYFDVNFEAVFIGVNQTTGAVTPARGDDLIVPSNPEPTTGANLYAIYVVQSNADSFISVYQYTPLAATPPNPANPQGGTPDPFAGVAPNFGITTFNGGTGVSVLQPDTGSILIGAIDPVTTPSPTLITSVQNFAGEGVMPAPAGDVLTPGITITSTNGSSGVQNDFGNMLIGGTVTGSVSIGANINEFYAGNILTGESAGGRATNYDHFNATANFVLFSPQTPTTSRVSPGNFSVAGDLGALLTTGSIGTDSTFTGVQPTPNYLTNFDLTVGGKLGELKVGNNEKGDGTASFAGTVEVGNSPYISQQTPYPTAAPAGSVNIIGNTAVQNEIEALATPNPDLVWQQGLLDLQNNTPADAEFLNSTPITDPSSGKLEFDKDGKLEFNTSVDGTYLQTNADTQNYYAAALLAGQSVQVSLTDTGTGAAAVSATTTPVLEVLIYDPDGRLIATNVDSSGGAQQFTPDRPGVYLFEVTEAAASQATTTYNLTVTGIPEQGISGISIGEDFSDVGIDSGIILGNADLGALEVGGDYTSTTVGPTPATASTVTAATPPVVADTSILVASGNFDAFVAGQIGAELGGAPNILYRPTLSVPNGSVGLVKSTTGILGLDTQFDPNYLTLATPQHVTDDLYATAIGGFIQTIDAATTFQGNLAVNAGIGTIRAGDMATSVASFIDVNANNVGADGIIDLIDVSGGFGTLAAGGPDIETNTGGDLRYLNVAGAIFRPLLFGGGEDAAVVYNAGQQAVFTDASGNVITATPVGPVTTTVITATTTPATNASTGTTNSSTSTTVTTTTTGPQISVLSYPLIDKAGQVPISISSDDGMTITDSGSNGSEINIANVLITGEGSPVYNSGTDAYGNTTIALTPPTLNVSSGTTTTTVTTANTDGSTTTTKTAVSGGGTSTFLDLTMGGPEIINVLQVTATCNADGVQGGVTSIVNNTQGEIASVTIQSAVPDLIPEVGTIMVHGNLGFTTPRATVAMDVPRAVITDGNLYPFVQQHTGVVVPGPAVNIDAYGGIGNVLVFSTLESVVANYGISEHVAGASAIPGQFNGIVGPIVAGELVPITNPIPTFGSLISIDVGQGVAYSGSGEVGFAGIYASGAIGVIDNAGNSGGAIRGDIVSEDDTYAIPGGTYVQGNAIGSIQLNNASIINSIIGTIDNIASPTPTFYDNFQALSRYGATASTATGGDYPPFTSSFVYEIGSIVVSGLGGIIGTRVVCADVGPVIVNNGGFGVLYSSFISSGVGKIAGITASGYGIRDTDIEGGGYVGQIVATGGGPSVSVLTYPIDVRESDIPNQVDPYFGFLPTVYTDLNAALGTSALQPNIPDVTDTGVVADCVFEGQEQFGGLVAQKVRTAEPLFVQETEPTPSVPNIPVLGTDFPMEINFGASVGPIRIFQETDGLQITTGHLVSFSPGTSVSRVGISVAGAINSLNIHGNFGQYITDPASGNSIPDSYISASGPSGTIGSLRVTGNLNGNIYANAQIGSVVIGGDLLGGITVYGQTTGLALGTLHVLGGIRDQSLTIDGSAGSIIANRSLGTSTGSLTIKGNVNLISVGANHKLLNSNLALALDVTGSLGSLIVYGKITGSVTTGIDLKNLSVTGDGTAGVIVAGNISVGGRIGTARIVNGSVGSSIIASGSISNFTIVRGSLLAPAIVESQIDSVKNFSITGGLSYGLYGSLLAPSGLNDKVDISGNLGDGTNAATITALSGTTFRIRGTIATNASIQVTSTLNLLEVDGSIQTGAVVAAHPLLRQKIKGDNAGSITIV